MMTLDKARLLILAASGGSGEQDQAVAEAAVASFHCG